MEKRLKIAVNTRFLIADKLEGIGLFTLETLKQMVMQHPEVDFVFLFDRSFDNQFIFAKNVTGVSLSPPARHPFLWYIWFEWSVKRWLSKNKPDLFLSMDGFTVLNTQTPTVTVIHDVAFEHFKDHVGGLVRKYYSYFVPLFAQKSDRLVAVSNFTKQDIVRLYDVPDEKIDVVYNAPKEEYQPISDERKSVLKSSLTDGKDFFLYVGSIHPRKNIVNLLLAFEAFKTATKTDVKLVLIGRKAWKFDAVEQTLNTLSCKQDVLFLGYLPSAEIATISASAMGMCYVSLFEGFGIPIVEAQQAGTLVITSNVTSMPEVAGDSALLVNPFSVDEIAQAMTRVYNEKSLRESLIQKGFENCKRFSWQQSAHNLWASCQKVINTP